MGFCVVIPAYPYAYTSNLISVSGDISEVAFETL